MFDHGNVGQDHREQQFHWCHSMANIKIYNRCFMHFGIISQRLKNIDV